MDPNPEAVERERSSFDHRPPIVDAARKRLSRFAPHQGMEVDTRAPACLPFFDA